MLGWEYTKHALPDTDDDLNSHRCVLYPGSQGRVLSWFDGETPSPRALVSKLRGQRVLLHHHHPMGYDISDDSLERNIEICSGWWNCMEIPEFVTELHRMLDRGLRLGFIGGSDNHERVPGLGGALTGVWATENTREAVFDALWNRRVLATTGLRPDLRFWVCDAFMGGAAQTRDVPRIRLEVRYMVHVSRIEIIRDGAKILDRQMREKRVSLDWADDTASSGQHYYYAHIVFEGEAENPSWNIASAYGSDAWTSPVWVHVLPS